MASISEREDQEVEAANASGKIPVVLIHGLWLLPSSWDPWTDFFRQAGYAPLTPDWPLAGRALAPATVAIDPGVFRGVLPLPGSVLKGVGPFLIDPRTRGRAITLTFDQFKYGWANALEEKEAKELYDTFHVAGSGIALVQMGNANLNPWTEAKVNTQNPDRGPLLIIDGEKDHTVPWAIANAAYKRQSRNPGVTEIVKIPNRGHALTIDHGWREVAQTALEFVKRFVPAKPD
jgi:pimeloyl-ACP methyl ester carboxylesterase